MAIAMPGQGRRTSADDIFDALHGKIASLKLLPGTRISEVEVAKQFDVSRQPVREAFIRLANLDLLLLRPQKATVVRRFSSEKIKRARFTRMAIESEIARRACKLSNRAQLRRLEQDLKNQKSAIKSKDLERFHELDYEFHMHLSEAAECGFMFGMIAESKALVDRLCVLSLSEPATMDDLYNDHVEIVEALKSSDADALVAGLNAHLSRLDDVLNDLRKSHADFFED